MNQPIALFDLDGTLADYDSTLRKGLEAIAGPDDPPIKDILREDEPAEWFVRRMSLITRQPGWFRHLPIYRPGFELLSMARSFGFEINILTKGPRANRHAWTEKVEWCDEHMPGVPTHIVSDKAISYGRVLVDDWVPYGEPWLKWRKRGLLILPAHPWNEGFEHPNAIRYTGDNFIEVSARLQHAFNRKDGED